MARLDASTRCSAERRLLSDPDMALYSLSSCSLTCCSASMGRLGRSLRVTCVTGRDERRQERIVAMRIMAMQQPQVGQVLEGRDKPGGD